MPYRRITFEKNQTYHILSHAVEERKIFDTESDCNRFIFQAYAANIGSPAHNLWKKDIKKLVEAIFQGEKISSKFIIKEHPPLVHFLDFSLVINHFHFYLVANIENGVPIYVMKLNGGFARYFNLKYNRKGALFAGPYKSIPIKTEIQSDMVSRYVSIINPLDVYQPGWRKKGLKNLEEALKFLGDYQFSSSPDRMGRRRSKILAPDEILERYFLGVSGKRQEYIESVIKDYLGQRLDPFFKFFLE